MARIAGRIHRWLKIVWKHPVLWLVVTGGVWLTERLFNITGTWLPWLKILSVYALLMLLWWAWQIAQKRVVIEGFLDYTGDQPKSVSRGVSTLLKVEFDRLRELYRVVDEQREIPTAVLVDKPLTATFKAEDISEFFKSAVSVESKFSLGPLEIPVGTFLALIGRLLQGPRIIGSLHKDKDRLILTAQMIDSKESYSWRVDNPIPLVQSIDQETRSLADMITELACRMLTDLVVRSVRWRATWTFSEGLREYRDSLRTPKNRILKLMRAERRFIETLAEDETFYLAYYNLGVVYTELEQLDAAAIAFNTAIEQYPNQWEAYYALAFYALKLEKYKDVIQLCDRIIALKPDNVKAYDMAKAYNLKGVAQRRLSLQDLKYLNESIDSRKKAVAQSWKALCFAKFEGENIANSEKNALNCLGNLAVAYIFQARESKGIKQWIAFQQAEALLRQALFLAPSNADLYFELGKIYFEQKKYELSIREYKSAVQIDPASAEYWAYLALAYFALKDEKSRQYAWEKFLDCAFDTSNKALEVIAKHYSAEDADRSRRIEKMKELKEEIEKLLGEDTRDVQKIESNIRNLREKLKEYEGGEKDWECIQIAFAMGRLHNLLNKPAKAVTYFRKGIEKLEGKYPQAVKMQGQLRAWLSRSLRKQGELLEALKEVEHALRLDPLSALERVVLAENYFDRNDFERAIDLWENALLIEPNEPATHAKIGIAYIKLGLDCRKTSQRELSFRQASVFLTQALGLYKSDDLEGKKWAYYWLGQLHYELDEYEKAISYFKIAQTLGTVHLVATYYLGRTYLENKAYDECVEQFRYVIREANVLIEKKPELLKENVGKEFEDQMSLGEVLAWAYLSQALSYAERDVNLKEALILARKAEKYIRGLDEGPSKVKCQASYADRTGWILYKQEKFDAAIKSLEHAVSQIADPGAYWHLALAYEHKSQKCKKKSQMHLMINCALRCCQHVKEIDIKGKYSQSINDILSHIREKIPGESCRN